MVEAMYQSAEIEYRVTEPLARIERMGWWLVPAAQWAPWAGWRQRLARVLLEAAGRLDPSARRSGGTAVMTVRPR